MYNQYIYILRKKFSLSLRCLQYINLDTNFKLEEDKKNYSTYLGINSGEVRDAL